MNSVINLHVRYKAYRQKLRHVWEEYCFTEYYGPLVHELIKNQALPPISFAPHMATHPKELRQLNHEKSTALANQVLLANSTSNRVLLDAVGCFEGYLSDVAKVVYLDYPRKLGGTTDSDANDRDTKILNVILESDTKEEILDRIIEERLRSIFYGKPVEFFTKDKARLEFGTYFKTNLTTLLLEYEEIIAKRNIVVHNSGRVDRKYLREVPGSSYKLGAKVPLDTTYLKRALCVVEWLAGISTGLVVKNIYKATPKGGLLETVTNVKNHFGAGI